MKAGAQKHQLKMTAAGKPGRETGETRLEDGKGGKKRQNFNMRGGGDFDVRDEQCKADRIR